MISAVILAAGRSRRMGRQKLLLPLGGKPLLSRVVDEVLRSPVEDVLVVVGPDGALLRQTLAGRRLGFVVNPIPDDGMLSSVRCGLRGLAPDCEAALVVLGDQPGLTAELVDFLVRAYQAGDRKILVPTCHGQRGHPILLPMIYREEALTSYDDVGLRGLLRAHPDEIVEVELNAAALLDDMDTPQDYERMARQFNA